MKAYLKVLRRESLLYLPYKELQAQLTSMAAKVETVEEAKRVVDSLVSTFQHGRFGLTVNEVIKAGSLGHGTAVPGDFDLDLVIYSDDVNARVIKEAGDPDKNISGYESYLHKLRSFLSTVPGVVLRKSKPHAVNFQYRGIDVDLLVSPNWSGPCDDFWGFIQDVPKDQAFDFSVNVSKWQVEFFSEQPSQVKEFIKRAKAWRNKVWEHNKEGRPKSYLLSLLVLRAYENARDRGVNTQNTRIMARETTEELKEMVTNHRSLNEHWERYYNFNNTGRRTYERMYSPGPPRILDPANPTNNLYKTGFGKSHDYERGDGNWTQLVANIETIDLTRTVEEIQHTGY